MNRELLETELRKYWNDEKMVKHCLKSTKYIEIEEGFLNCCDSKPTIENEMYYNDEYAAPSTEKEGFFNHNKRNMPELLTDKYRYFLRINYSGNNSENLLAIETVRYYDDPGADVIRELTTDDITKVNNAIAEVRADYTKRLETYYKRYADKITTHGYWANR